MSETTSAPAAPAAPAPSSDSGPYLGPPAATQQPLSVSEAARVLNAQRRKEGGEPPPAAPDRKPSPNELTAVSKPAEPAAQPAETSGNTRKSAETGLSAMDKALGVPEGQAPAAIQAADAIEIEGQRYTTAQLREAVLKSADYTKKTQEISAKERQLQDQAAALATVLPYIQPELARLQQLVQGTAKPDPALLETDPQRYLRERAAWEAAVDEQNRLGGLTQIQQQARERAMEQQVAAANEQLAKEFPFWADPKERSQAQQDIVAWATTKGGFSIDELRGLTSPHHLKAMMKARAYDRLVEGAKTAAPMQQMASPVRGVSPPPAPSERIQAAEQAFDERANIRNATQLLTARRSANGSAQR